MIRGFVGCADRKSLALLGYLCSLLLLSSGTARAEAVSAPVCRRILVLAEQSDLTLLSQGEVSSRQELAERHRMAVTELAELASTTQSRLVEILDVMQGDGRLIHSSPLHIINAIAVEVVPSAVPELSRLPGVAFVEFDPPIELVGSIPLGDGRRSTLDNVEPGLIEIRAPEVWALGITGAGVLVSNLDVGVNANHPALWSRWRGNNGYPAAHCWRDYYGGSPTPVQYANHGTQTMGIQCAMVPGDTVGIAWGARFIAAALDLQSGQSTVSTALLAMQWLLDPDSNAQTFNDVPRVISNSWGIVPGATPPCYDILNLAIDNCEAAGIAVVWAAGNESLPGSIRIPADRSTTATNSFSVGAWNASSDTIWNGSSQGPSACGSDPFLRIKPEVVAPGVGIRSTGSGSSYVTDTGTSFSVAHVAGVLALMAEANPGLTSDSLKKILLETAVDEGIVGPDNVYGNGRIDALAAVQGAMFGLGWIAGTVTDLWGNPLVGQLSMEGYPHKFYTDGLGQFVAMMPASVPLNWRMTVPLFEEFARTDTLWVEIQLAASGDGMLAGSVIDCRGGVAVDALVEILGSGFQSAVDVTGRFSFVLSPGTYDLLAMDGFCANGFSGGNQVWAGGITDIEIVLPFNPAHFCSDPAQQGYTVCDSYDESGPEYDWVETAPSTDGMGLALNLDDDGTLPVVLPFPVRFYGSVREKLWVHGNGFVSFDSLFGAAYINAPLPVNVWPAIFGYWDDYSDVYGGEICVYNDRGRGRFVAEWYEVPRYDQQGAETFQIQVFDPRLQPDLNDNSKVEVHYRTLEIIDECTIGIDADNNNGHVQYVCNGAYPSHASPVEDGLAIRFNSAIGAGEVPGLTIVNPNLSLAVDPNNFVDTTLILQNVGTLAAAYELVTPQDLTSLEYVVSDSRQGGPPYSFFDISSIGQNVGAVGDDRYYYPSLLPWPFKYFDQWYDKLVIATNGYIGFVTCDADWSNDPLDLPDNPYCMLAPFWDDMNFPAGDIGRIYTYYDATNDRYIVQYHNAKLYVSNHR